VLYFYQKGFANKIGYDLDRNLQKKKRLVGRKRLWIRRLSGDRKEQDYLGKPKKVHSSVT
jgi:hypothetical protein